MEKKSKTILTAVLMAMAIIEMPLFYYYDSLLWIVYAFTGFILTLLLIINVISRRSTNSPFHIIGLIGIIVLVVCRRNTNLLMAKLDFNLQKEKRLEIVKQVKNGTLKKGNPLYDELIVEKNDTGIVSIEFYIHKGFLGRYSSFMYTNIRDTNSVDKKPPNEMVKKLENNWYLIGF